MAGLDSHSHARPPVRSSCLHRNTRVPRNGIPSTTSTRPIILVRITYFLMRKIPVDGPTFRCVRWYRNHQHQQLQHQPQRQQRHSQRVVRVASEMLTVWLLVHGRPLPITVAGTRPRWVIRSLGSRNGLSSISWWAWIIFTFTITRLSIRQHKRRHNCFPSFVTLHPWPAKICNKNRPNHKNPGERSSQYAAEASCRERYGPLTDWMAFIDTNEYLVPMRNASWETVLQEAEEQGTHVLKMRSSRGKPRTKLMEVMDDPIVCASPP
jgi:hypothetical protein